MRSSFSGETRLHLPRVGIIKSSYFIVMRFLPDNLVCREILSGAHSKIGKFPGVVGGMEWVFRRSQVLGEQINLLSDLTFASIATVPLKRLKLPIGHLVV